MSDAQGRTIILAQHYFPSVRDGKYNLHFFYDYTGCNHDTETTPSIYFGQA